MRLLHERDCFEAEKLRQLCRCLWQVILVDYDLRLTDLLLDQPRNILVHRPKLSLVERKKA